VGVVVLLPGDIVRAGWTCCPAEGTIVPDISLTDSCLTPLAKGLCPCLSYLLPVVLVSLSPPGLKESYLKGGPRYPSTRGDTTKNYLGDQFGDYDQNYQGDPSFVGGNPSSQGGSFFCRRPPQYSRFLVYGRSHRLGGPTIDSLLRRYLVR
jgi:hypothetical protein